LPLGKLVANARNEPTQSHGNIAMVAKLVEIAAPPTAQELRAGRDTIFDESVFKLYINIYPKPVILHAR
jgi:hypothetical protein